MTEASPPTHSRGPWPWGLVGMVGLLGLIEPALARRDADFAGYIPADWKLAGHAAARRVAESRVLCFGDSEVKHALLPALLADRLGGPSYNLAVIGGQPPSSYFLLRRALEAGARPSAVVLNAFPALLASDARINERQWPELLTAREAIDLAWTTRDPYLLACSLLAGRLASVRARREVRAALLAALRGEPSPSRREGLAYRRNWRINRGAQVAPRNPGFGDDPGPPGTASPAHRWKCKTAHSAYLRRFLSLAASRDIPVYWLMPTLSPAWQARREQTGVEVPYVAFVRSLQRSFPNLVVIDGRHSRYDRSVFVDPAHLDRRGAAVLSTEVAALIRRRLDTREDRSRWVELPPYRDVAADAAIEDLDQSRLAMRDAEGRAAR
jgi:hypothetical protein